MRKSNIRICSDNFEEMVLFALFSIHERAVHKLAKKYNIPKKEVKDTISEIASAKAYDIYLDYVDILKESVKDKFKIKNKDVSIPKKKKKSKSI